MTIPSKALNLYQFNLLPRGLKIVYLWDCCHYVSFRTVGNYRITLYDCANFYAEIWHKNNVSRIQKIDTFHGTKPLAPYLSQIDISELTSCLNV
ncbi:MAG: hypothetical protein ACPG5B_01395 [Chitinophagales bacterium]